MRQTKSALAILVSAVFLFFPLCLSAQAPVVSRSAVPAPAPDNSLKLILELQSLREEISMLLGTIEELEYKVSRLEKNQKENYSDLDGRVRDLYSGKVATPSVPLNVPQSNNPSVPTEIPPSTVDNAVLSSQLYSEGFGALRQGDREKAITSLEELVNSYPDSKEVANARYWLGETYWLANQKEKSRQAFVQLLENTPNYRKAGDAMYRLGIIYDQLGDFDTAFDYMSQVLLSGSSQAIAAQAWIKENQPEKPSVSPEVKQLDSESAPINE